MRLSNWDYAQQAFYFVTICAYERLCLFGEVREGKMVLNEAGEMVVRELVYSCQLRPIFLLDSYIVMPNHIHFIVQNVGAHCHAPHDGWALNADRGALNADCGARSIIGAHDNAPLRREKGTLGSLVAGFKFGSMSAIRGLLGFEVSKIWQRNYYDRIIRTESELFNVRRYIQQNPQKWDLDDHRS